MDIDEAPRLDLCILSPASATTEIEGVSRLLKGIRACAMRILFEMTIHTPNLALY